MSERSYLSIGQVLDLLKDEFPDLTISKIRFLESQGLLDPERTPSGYRKFYDADVERLRFILRAQQDQYLPLKVIKGRLGVDGEGPDGEDAGEDDAPDPARIGGNGRSTGPDLDVSRHPSMAGGIVSRSGGSPAAAGPPSAGLRSVPPAPVPAAAPMRPGPMDAREMAMRRAGEEPLSMTLEELAAASGLSTADVTELERFGLLAGRRIAGTTYYDADCATIASVAARFHAFGVEARHLRMYRTAVEREANFFEQVVTPMLKQRNPQARRQAVETLLEMSRLGSALREAVLRQALREYTGGG